MLSMIVWRCLNIYQHRWTCSRRGCETGLMASCVFPPLLFWPIVGFRAQIRKSLTAINIRLRLTMHVWTCWPERRQTSLMAPCVSPPVLFWPTIGFVVQKRWRSPVTSQMTSHSYWIKVKSVLSCSQSEYLDHLGNIMKFCTNKNNDGDIKEIIDSRVKLC